MNGTGGVLTLSYLMNFPLHLQDLDGIPFCLLGWSVRTPSLHWNLCLDLHFALALAYGRTIYWFSYIGKRGFAEILTFLLNSCSICCNKP